MSVRSIRQQLRLTQEQLAQHLSVTVSTVNRWENDHAAPSPLARRAIEDLARRCGLLGDPAAPMPVAPGSSVRPLQ